MGNRFAWNEKKVSKQIVAIFFNENILFEKIKMLTIKQEYEIKYLLVREDSDVTAADGAMTSLPMVPFEE